MGEKERAEALLQAAGVNGVKVEPAAETVTMTLAEAEALRAAAAAVETPGQAYVRQQAERAATQLPEGIMSRDQIAAWEQLPAPKSAQEQREQVDLVDQVKRSLRYHAEQS